MSQLRPEHTRPWPRDSAASRCAQGRRGLRGHGRTQLSTLHSCLPVTQRPVPHGLTPRPGDQTEARPGFTQIAHVGHLPQAGAGSWSGWRAAPTRKAGVTGVALATTPHSPLLRAPPGRTRRRSPQCLSGANPDRVSGADLHSACRAGSALPRHHRAAQAPRTRQPLPRAREPQLPTRGSLPPASLSSSPRAVKWPVSAQASGGSRQPTRTQATSTKRGRQGAWRHERRRAPVLSSAAPQRLLPAPQRLL